MFLARNYKKNKDGTRYVYWSIRKTVWDKAERRNKQQYVAYVGPQKELTLKRARELAKRLGLRVAELQQRIKGLKIAE